MNLTAPAILKLRTQLQLTQPQFGQLLGVHWMTVSKWERGILVPNDYQLALMIEFEKAVHSRHVQAQKDALGAMLLGAGIAAVLLLLLDAAKKS